MNVNKLWYRESDMTESITALIADLQNSIVCINEATEEAIFAAGHIIAREQRRILKKAVFKRDKKRHIYAGDLSGEIKVWKKQVTKNRQAILSGFDGKTIEKNPELLCIEFGRPSIYRGKEVDKLGRAVGDFPEVATVMPIRVGVELAKKEAFETFKEKMFQSVEKDWNSG